MPILMKKEFMMLRIHQIDDKTVEGLFKEVVGLSLVVPGAKTKKPILSKQDLRTGLPTDRVKASNARMTGKQEHWRGQKSGAPYDGGRDGYSDLEGSAKGVAYADMLRKRDASNKRNADIVRQANLHEPTKKQDSTEIVKTDRMISFKESISKAVNTYLNETGDTKRRNKAAKRERVKAKGMKNPDITIGQTVAARRAAKHEPEFSGAATVRAGREVTKAEDKVRGKNSFNDK